MDTSKLSIEIRKCQIRAEEVGKEELTKMMEILNHEDADPSLKLKICKIILDIGRVK